MEVKISHDLIPYPVAIGFMEQRVADIASASAPETLWLLEHPPLYTAGTSAKSSDLLEKTRFPVFKTGRGGQYTYHGPGQRVGYVMLNLKQHKPDVRWFVHELESWIIDTLLIFGIQGQRRKGLVGIWVPLDGGYSKIAALGIRVRKWVSFHGISLNINPDLSHFTGIVPCGVREGGVTSLHALGVEVSTAEVDTALIKTFKSRFF